MKKLAIITTHPIQYYAPLFKLLQERNVIQAKVFYTWERGAESFDRGFGKTISWDIPLLEGYEYTFVSNNGEMKKGFWDMRNPTLNSEIESWGADAILVFGWNYRSHLKAMLHFKGKIPVLFRGDSHLLDKRSAWKEILRKIWLSWVYKHVDYALYVGTNNKNYYLEYGLQPEQLVFAPHAIDNDRFFDDSNQTYARKASALRKELGYSDDNMVFLFIVKLEDKKDPLLLLEAFLQVSNENACLLYVGNGPLEAILKEQTKNNLRIKFIGFQNQSFIPIMYRIADIVVLPSKGPGETWGLVTNEAMSSGKPLIVSDVVGCAIDLIENDLNGYIFKSKDVNDLKSKMLNFTSKKISASMGDKSLEIIKNWSFDKLSTQIEDLV